MEPVRRSQIYRVVFCQWRRAVCGRGLCCPMGVMLPVLRFFVGIERVGIRGERGGDDEAGGEEVESGLPLYSDPDFQSQDARHRTANM